MKNLWMALVILPMSAHAAAVVPSPGGLAFVSINADEDGFALVSFVDLAADTELFMTDQSWNGLASGSGGAFEGGGGVLTWTVGSALAAGSVVRFSSVQSAALIGASHGSVLRSSGSMSLALTDESLYVYAMAGSTVVPLAAIGNGSDFATELAGSGLDAASLALSGRVDFAEYQGPRSGETALADYRSKVFDPGQWLVRKSTDESLTAPDMTAFSVAAAVPEADTYAMMLAGLGVMSIVARRRSSAAKQA